MNIIEVKNNLVKLSYDEDLKLASFIKITDLRNTYIAQVLHLESSRVGKTAIARLIFNFKCGVQAYDGSVPSIQAQVELLEDNFLANQLDKTNPIVLGKLGDSNVAVSANLLKDKPLICAEKHLQCVQILNNIIKQNEVHDRKTVVIDITGEVQGNKIIATKDFKIPLNQYSIDYIFDRAFDDLTAENKAFIQNIFFELNEYIKTVEFIPFNDFNAVIDYEFKRTNQLQLMILKNRLTQFDKTGIFAQSRNEFKILDDKLDSDNTIIIDLSTINESLQAEYIAYIYAQMEKHNTNYYSFVSLNNNNSSKEMLNAILGTKNVFSSIICPYSYKYINELKQCSKNMFMFTPLKQQNDFGAYDIFLRKLAENEFVLYGKSTKFTPLILDVRCDISEMLIKETPKVEELPVEVPFVVPTQPIVDIIEDIETPAIEENEPIEIVEDAIVEPLVEELDIPEIVEVVDESVIEPIAETIEEEIEIVETPFEPVMESVFESEEEMIQEEVLPTEFPIIDNVGVNEEVGVNEVEISIEEPQKLSLEEGVNDGVNPIEESQVLPVEGVGVNNLEEIETVAEVPLEGVNEDLNTAEEPSSNVEEEVIDEPSEEIVEEQEEEPVVEIQEDSKPKVDEELEDMAALVQAELNSIAIDIDDNELADAIKKNSIQVEEKPNLDPDTLFMAKEESVAEESAIEIVEDDSDLTDEDLDLIDEMSDNDVTEMNNEVEISDATPRHELDLEEPVSIDKSKIEIVEDVEDGVNEDVNPVEEPQDIQEETLIQENTVSEIIEESIQEAEQEEVSPETKKEPSITDQILQEEAERLAREEAERPDPIEEQIEKPQPKKRDESLETRAGATPIVPVYSAEIPDEDIVESDPVEQGDVIVHAEFGRGVVEKIINYGDRTLCSINFDTVGRRLLDPKISEMKKV